MFETLKIFTLPLGGSRSGSSVGFSHQLPRISGLTAYTSHVDLVGRRAAKPGEAVRGSFMIRSKDKIRSSSNRAFQHPCLNRPRYIIRGGSRRPRRITRLHYTRLYLRVMHDRLGGMSRPARRSTRASIHGRLYKTSKPLGRLRSHPGRNATMGSSCSRNDK